MTGLRGPNPGMAVLTAGQLAPIEPVYTKPNSPSGIAGYHPVPSAPTDWKAPVVHRGQDTRGMRYLWARLSQRMPVSELGTGPDIGIGVWKSNFQAFQVSLRDYGFYDLLYRSGYPGFNLGLSFKVPVNPSVGTNSPGANIHMAPAPTRLRIQVLRRATGTPNTRSG